MRSPAVCGRPPPHCWAATTPAGGCGTVGRTTTLGAAVWHALADQLHAGDTGHPWTGRTFRVGWGSREQLSGHLVAPELVAEVAVDIARHSAGRWRHPVRLTRIRTDMRPGEVPFFGAAG
ncbi:hypothetical protein ACFWWC_26505 [Streptomyces sp. NPDC058642]|uniref:hypothetical protein n=1 Tax=Streptomyces sp. NPDC058642 TaxID=3346572 RepID=UPI00365D329B